CLNLQARHHFPTRRSSDLNQLYQDVDKLSSDLPVSNPTLTIHQPQIGRGEDYHLAAQEAEEVEESLSLVEKESDLIKKALKKHRSEEHTSELQSRENIVCR